MHIFKEVVQPNGALTSVHKVFRVDVQPLLEKVMVTVNSYSSSVQGDLISWQDVHEMPLIAFQQEVYPGNVLSWLIGADGPLVGGSVVQPTSSDLELMRQAAWQRIVARREIALNVGTDIVVGANTYRLQTDRKSRDDIATNLVMSMLATAEGATYGGEWELLDGTVVPLTEARIRRIGKSIQSHWNSTFSVARGMRNWVFDSARTEADFSTFNVDDPVALGLSAWPV